MRYIIFLCGIYWSVSATPDAPVTTAIFQGLLSFQHMPQYNGFRIDLKQLPGIHVQKIHKQPLKENPDTIVLTLVQPCDAPQGQDAFLYTTLLALAQQQSSSKDPYTKIKRNQDFFTQTIVFETTVTPEMLDTYKKESIADYEEKKKNNPRLSLLSELITAVKELPRNPSGYDEYKYVKQIH